MHKGCVGNICADWSPSRLAALQHVHAQQAELHFSEVDWFSGISSYTPVWFPHGFVNASNVKPVASTGLF